MSQNGNFSKIEAILIKKKGDQFKTVVAGSFTAGQYQAEDIYILAEVTYEKFVPVRFESVGKKEITIFDILNINTNSYFYEQGSFALTYESKSYPSIGNWTWTRYRNKTPDVIAIDFDGVINSYSSGFVSIDNIPDPPVPGSIDFLRRLHMEDFKIVIFSTRCSSSFGISAIIEYLRKHGLEENILNNIKLSPNKPRAKLYIDDHGYQFSGTFPSIEYIRKFKPWYDNEE